MEVFECIRRRRTIREYKKDPIPEDVLEKILQAGRWSPSSSNSQPWHFVVIQDSDTLSELGRIATQGPFISDAALAIVIVMENAPRPQLDAGRAIQQMELVAWSEGLGMLCRSSDRRTTNSGERTARYSIRSGINNDNALWIQTNFHQPSGYSSKRSSRNGSSRKIWGSLESTFLIGL